MIFCAARGFCYKVPPDTRVVNPNEEVNKFIDSTLVLVESLYNRNTKKDVLGMNNF